MLDVRRHRSGFTLVEIMIVVAIVALLAAIAIPGFLRARKRSQAATILNDLRMLDAAVDQYAIEMNKKAGDPFAWSDLKPYIKQNSKLYHSFANDGSGVSDVLGNTYYITGYIDQHPDDASNVAVNLDTYNALSDVADSNFWQPFGIQSTGEPAPADGPEPLPP